jgi:hypothetical protein
MELRKAFGSKREEVPGDCRNYTLRKFMICAAHQHLFRCLRWAYHVARLEENRNTYGILVEKCKCKSPLGRVRPKWEDNIEKILMEWKRCLWTIFICNRVGTSGWFQ